MTGVDEVMHDRATEVARLLAGRTLACAESFTAGVVAQTFAAIEGSGQWFRGGVVAYQRDSKADVLDVDPALPLVSGAVAEQMARGVARRMHADVAVSTTGAAGPDGLDGAAAGTVVFGFYVDGSVRTRELRYDENEPGTVITRAARDAIAALAETLASAATGSPEATVAPSGDAMADRR